MRFLTCALLFFCVMIIGCEMPSDKPGSFFKPVIVTLPAPDKPLVTAADTFITVKWNAMEGVTHYEVYCGLESSPPAQPSATVTERVCILTDLTNKRPYFIWIKAVYGNKKSDFSERARAVPWPSGEAPERPSNIVVKSGIDSLALVWDASGGAERYQIYLSTSIVPGGTPLYETSETAFVIPGLQNEEIYYLWLKAHNAGGESAFSDIKIGVPKTPAAPPAAPGKPVLTPLSGRIIVSWQPVEMAGAYEVWAAQSNNTNLAHKYADAEGGALQSEITGLSNGVTWYVWLKARNSKGTSGLSAAASVIPSASFEKPRPPDAPQVVVGKDALVLRWAAVDGASSYEVFLSDRDDSASAVPYGAEVSGAELTVSGLTNGTIYYFWLKAKNDHGASSLGARGSGAPSVFAGTPVVPPAPAVTAGNGSLALSWTASEGALLYEVWAGTQSNSAAATKRGADVSGLSGIINGLSNNTRYYVWLKAKNNTGISGVSAPASGTPLVSAGPPLVPGAPEVRLASASITLSWQAVEGANAYEVYRAATNDSAAAVKHGGDITSALSAVITGLTNGTTYYFWLKAKNDKGSSDFSGVTSAKPVATPAAPTISADNAQLTVSWSALAGADNYDLFCGTGTNPPVSPTWSGNATSRTLTGLTNGTTYNVWVRGKNSTGAGALSPAVSGTPLGNIGTVTLSPADMKINISWQAVAGAAQYEVYYSTSSSIPASPAQTVTATSTTMSSLTNGTTYYVWVKPKNPNGIGAASAAVNAKPIGNMGTVTLIVTSGKIQVTWTAVAGAVQYEVYYSTSSSMPGSPAQTVGGTSATINSLTNGTIYYVWVKPKNTSGAGAVSAVVSGVPTIVGLYKGATYAGATQIGNHVLSAALSYISNNAVSGDNYYIVIGTNGMFPSSNLSYSNKTVGITLMADGVERTVQPFLSGSLFTVDSGVTLTLENNVTLKGVAENSRSLVYINTSGTFIMNGGKISDNIINKYSFYGGGVYVNGGTFIMRGGEISGNRVYTTYSSSYGGGVYVHNGTFTMSGGKISGNHSFSSSSYSYGGGVAVSDGTFTMSGGEISGNHSFSSSSYSYGGGVYINGAFTMSGGEISGNYSSYSYGGGVYVDSLGRFIKLASFTDGVITGYDSGTTTANQSSTGRAVFVNSSLPKKLEKTVVATKALDSHVAGEAGGWTE